MGQYCMIEIAFDDMQDVRKTVDILLSKKLVASTHIIGSDSSWNWNQERENKKEYLLQVKTKTLNQQAIFDIVCSIHPYDCFEFAVYELTSISKDYLQWIEREVI